MTQPTPIFDPARLRSHMERDGIDLVLATSRPNVGYLSNWFTHHWTWDWPFWFEVDKEYDGVDYLLLAGVPADPKEAFFVTFYHHVSSVRQKSWIEDIRGAGRPGYTPREGLESVILEPATTITHVESAVEAIKDHGFAEATIGVEMCRMAQSVYAELAERLPKARFVDCFEMMLEVRAVKSADEVAKLRRAAEITTRCFNDVIFPMMRDKTTPYEIYQEAIALAARERGYFLFLHMFVDGGHVSLGAGGGAGNKPVPYNIDPDTRLKDDQLAFVDSGCGYKGYCADMCRNLVIGGRPTNNQHRVHGALIDARVAIRAAIRPGIKASDLFHIAVDVLDKHNLGLALSMVGHGLGLSIHENPALTAYDHRPLEPGMVMNIEPNLEVPGMTMFNVEDAGVVTEDGFDPFVTTLTTDLDALARV